MNSTPRPFLTVLATLLFSVLSSYGQAIFSIAEGSATSCSGVLYDSGGQGALGYSDNENYTFVLCPEVPGSVVFLTFQTFNLDQSGTSGTWDHLSIHDGDDTGAPSLGDYVGTDLQNIIVSGTVFNTTGCLTLVFQSNSTGTGVFSASIDCALPCSPPVAAATMSLPSPVRICPGTSVQFDASGSTAAPGQVISGYSWRFGQTVTVDTTIALLAYTFDQPGSYPVSLIVTDSNGCASTNAVELEILVGTAPMIWLDGVDSVICIGQALTLSATVEATSWTNNSVDYGAGIALPDDVGQPFTSDIVLTGFAPGSSITSTDDLGSICVDMEHSFMGDLVLQVFCPNGQSMILHQQGGGGTYIGGANDYDPQEPGPGECWHYCWSPLATNGTWMENADVNFQLGGNPPNNALIPGTYESVDAFSNLIGCPFNGTWTFQSTDLWGADNGYLCGWDLYFDPALGGDTTAFVPVYGAGCDSTFWSGNDMTWTDAGCDSILVSPSNAGVLELTYTAIDNFGCTHDTLISVEVLPPSDPYCITLGLAVPVNGTIQVFPVPAADHVTITGPAAFDSFTLFDTGGRELRTGPLPNVSGPRVISLEDLNQGMYVLELVGPSGRSRVPLFRE